MAPSASITSFAASRIEPPTAAITPPWIAMSPSRPAAPLPSTSVPPRMM